MDLTRYREIMKEPPTIDQIGGWAFEFQSEPLLPIGMRAAGVKDAELIRDPYPKNASPAARLA